MSEVFVSFLVVCVVVVIALKILLGLLGVGFDAAATMAMKMEEWRENRPPKPRPKTLAEEHLGLEDPIDQVLREAAKGPHQKE